ncbi:MAG TPA: NAD-glutamate dehydrogenase domain-containing protein, partial [Trueperaceae bacterium]
MKQLHKQISSSQDGGSDLLESFAQVLFGKAGPEFLEEFDPDTLMAIAVEGLDFLQDKDAGELKVRVYNPRFGAEGWETNYTVLELCLADRPFVVDSVRAELRRRGYELYHLLHPILEIGRDDAGRIEYIGEEGGGLEHDAEQADRRPPQAYELYLIERIEDPEEQRALAEAVRGVLTDVVLATGDYRAMRRKAEELSAYLASLQRAAAEKKDRERAEELEEFAAFMSWLDADNFVFLGYREYDIVNAQGVPSLQVDPDAALGILRKLDRSAYREPVPLSDIPEALRERITGGRVLIVTKTNAESTVHRPARMDYIGVKRLSESGEVEGEQRFVGLFTSKALSTPVEEIPILRRKLRQVLAFDKALPGSHDFKQIVSIFNSIPREELFWSDAARLHQDIRTIMGLAQERGVRLTVRPDPLGRGLAVMVIMPRERFHTDVRRRIQRFLYERLAATHVDYHLAMGEDEAQVRFHFFFTTGEGLEDLNLSELEREVAELTRGWEDHLFDKLVGAKGEMAGRRLAARYAGAFDERYKADTSAGVALRDIENLEDLGDRDFVVDIVNPVDERKDSATHLRIYHRRHTLVLSDILPLLENLGMKVLEQVSYRAEIRGEDGPSVRGIDIFRVQDGAGRILDVRDSGERLVGALMALLDGRAENDPLNRLVLYADLSIRQVALLRTYQMYYGQLDAATSRRFISDTLLGHPEVARLLVRYFGARFDPARPEGREERMQEVAAAFKDSLSEVSSLPEDRTLRGLFNLMEATVRSNYFLDRPYISFKLDSHRVDTMPAPRPLFEVGVAGPGVEGAHLRGGKVARGGIRWSDRPDDFRTEVLGLMKTQMTKNAV